MSDSANLSTFASSAGEPNSPAVADSLAIEVIGREGSIALFAGPRLVVSRALEPDSPAAASLIPTIEELAHEFLPEGRLTLLRGLSVAAGPGSFTGLRIAVTTAKTLAYALNVPMVAVNSLSAIAATAIPIGREPAWAETEDWLPRDRVLVGLSAYRGQVYRGRFEFGVPAKIDLIPAEEWKRELQQATTHSGVHEGGAPDQSGRNGDDKKSAKKTLLMGDRAVFDRTGLAIDPAQWCGGVDRAVGVGRLGASLLQRGETTSAMDLVPDYLRPSAAEEQAAKQAGQTLA